MRERMDEFEECVHNSIDTQKPDANSFWVDEEKTPEEKVFFISKFLI